MCFPNGHCYGHCTGTVRALYGHCVLPAFSTSRHGGGLERARPRRTLQGARVFLGQFCFPRETNDVLHFRIRGARASGLFQGSLGGTARQTARAVAPPAAAAADLQRLEWYAQINPSTGAPWDANASMVNRRPKVYRFCHRVEKPRGQLPFCTRCFAELVTSQAATWAAAHQG